MTIRLVLAVLLLLLPNFARAANIEGHWRTAERDGLVEIRPCGDLLCGYLIAHDQDPAIMGMGMRMGDSGAMMRSYTMMGLLLLDHFRRGPSDWRDGSIHNPDNGKSYEGDLKLIDQSRLKVTGCLVRPLCGSQVWTRTP